HGRVISTSVMNAPTAATRYPQCPRNGVPTPRTAAARARTASARRLFESLAVFVAAAALSAESCDTSVDTDWVWAPSPGFSPDPAAALATAPTPAGFCAPARAGLGSTAPAPTNSPDTATPSAEPTPKIPPWPDPAGPGVAGRPEPCADADSPVSRAALACQGFGPAITAVYGACTAGNTA